MKKIIMLFALALACVGVRSQTLLSRSYDVSPVISYTVFEPQKDTVYYWQINNVNSAKMIESFYLRFRGRNELQRTLKFLVSLEGEEKGRTYRLDDTIDGNEVTTGKVEGFLFIPSAEGVTIENKKGFFHPHHSIPTKVYLMLPKVALMKLKERNNLGNSCLNEVS